MAEIRPLRAWRYNSETSRNIESLTSPLFDVVSFKQLEKLYRNPNSSIHLSVPQGPDPTSQAKNILQNWKINNIIQQDPIPGIYVYYQNYVLPGTSKEYWRKGFICNIRTYDWEEKVILNHENTMPHSVEDRKSIIASTEMHVSPTHGLYSDPEHQLEELMEYSMEVPIYETENYQGVRDMLSVIHDAKAIQKFVDLIKTKQVILADGHHRYAASIAYKNEMAASNPTHSGQEGYNYHFIYLTNMESDDLKILPTHRLIYDYNGISEEDFIYNVSKYFKINPIEEVSEIPDIIPGKKFSFGIMLGDEAFHLRLKEEFRDQVEWNLPDAVRNLDITILHYFLIEKGLGIPREQQNKSNSIGFQRNFSDCLTKVIRQEVKSAIIMNEISIEDIKNVCLSGYTMPQKTTFFYPKVICGFLFNSIKEDEFQLYPNLRI